MATLVQRTVDGFIKVSTELKKHQTQINGNLADLSTLSTTNKSSLVASINELKNNIDALALAAGATINDASTSSTTQTWSVSKLMTEMTNAVNSAINAVTGAAPGALDTLVEIATALENNPNIVATLTAGLATRLRFDAAQALSDPEKAQVCANAGIGNPDTNFVTVIESSLV